MSKEQLKAFLNVVKTDAGLQKQIEAAGDALAVMTIANNVGFRITVEDVNFAQGSNSTKWVGCVIPCEEDWLPDCLNEVPMPPVPIDEELGVSEEIQIKWKFLYHEWHEIDHLQSVIEFQSHSRHAQRQALENKPEEKKTAWSNTELDDCIW